MYQKEKKLSHSNDSNRISDSSYDASVHSSEINTEIHTLHDFRRTIEARNINKTIKEIQMKNGDPSDASSQWTKSLCQFIFGCGSLYLLNQEKFLNKTQILNQKSIVSFV